MLQNPEAFAAHKHLQSKVGRFGARAASGETEGPLREVELGAQ